MLKRDWAERLRYEGVAIENPDYHIWGSSPIRGEDGKVHVFAARFPVKYGFDCWDYASDIAHYVSDRPEGPFEFVDVLLKPGESAPGSWDAGTQHNPFITRIDERYVLLYSSNTATKTDPARGSRRIGMMTAMSVNGPWEKAGMVLAPPAPDDTSIWSHKSHNPGSGVDNPALVKHPNGKYYLYYRAKFPGLAGENSYGVAIAEKLEGPYVHHPDRVINNPRYVEDPYVFVHQGIIYMLVTDNHRGKGLLLTSEDGLHFEFDEAVLGFDTMSAYIDPETVRSAPNYRGRKFERPQLLMEDGVPTHLYAPAGANINGGPGTCCYVLKILPLNPGEASGGPAGTTSSEAAEFHSRYNVVWDSPSKDSSGSMPTGNGDVGLNLWVEEGGDLLFYISKTDAWMENSKLAKLGRVRVQLDPSPFEQGRPFRQELRLRESEIAITAGQEDNSTRLRVRVDANHPVVHVHVDSKTPLALQATVESWRTERKRSLGKFEGEYGQEPVSPDRFLEGRNGRIVWYHRNNSSLWRAKMTYQHLGPVIDKLGLEDPLRHRTFGGIMMGEGLVPDGTATLKSAKPATKHHARIHVLTAQTATADEWLEQVEKNVARYEALPAAKVRHAHSKSWEDFWNRSWIHVSGAEDAKVPSQSYALQRYITACAGRGAQPVKFNGSIFVDGRDPRDGTKPYDPDSRAWGPPYWFQNTRLIYWPLLATGDLDLMQPYFRMYRKILPLCVERTRIYYNHGGAFYPETLDFWGTYRNRDYGVAVNGRWVGKREPPAPPDTDWDKIWSNPRQGKPVGEVHNTFIRYEYCGGLELSAMMLDYFDYTGDREFAAGTLVPIADAVLQFYYEHYPRDEHGRLRIYPSAALENREQPPFPQPWVWSNGCFRAFPEKANS